MFMFNGPWICFSAHSLQNLYFFITTNLCTNASLLLVFISNPLGIHLFLFISVCCKVLKMLPSTQPMLGGGPESRHF